jgi:hypothetical protein
MASLSVTALINELIEKLHRVHVKLYPNYLKDSGGAVVITGHRIKVEGTKPGVGIAITGTRTGGTPYTNAILPPYVENTASKVIAILPAGIPEGTFKIRITTQFTGGSSLLKDVRMIESAPLTVGSPTQSGETPTAEGASYLGQ